MNTFRGENIIPKIKKPLKMAASVNDEKCRNLEMVYMRRGSTLGYLQYLESGGKY